MSAILHVQSPQHETRVRVLQLVHHAVVEEISRLQMALRFAEERLIPFEEKYHCSSEEFLRTFTAEDREHGDDEYVEWAGEYKLMLQLRERLRQLQEVEYAPE